MTEEQIKIELRKINEGEDWNSLFNYIMLLEQDIRNLIAQRDEREKETIKLKKDIVKATTNWNELKKWLIRLQKLKGINQQGFSWGVAQEVLDKIQELEQGKDE